MSVKIEYSEVVKKMLADPEASQKFMEHVLHPAAGVNTVTVDGKTYEILEYNPWTKDASKLRPRK